MLKPVSQLRPASGQSAASSAPVPPAPSDREIALGIARGEDWAADALYTRVQPVVDRSLRRILRSTGPDYDDLVQAAFERIITVLSRKPLGGSCELRAWSAAVTSHVALDWLRRRVRERRLFWSPLARPTDSSPPAPELDSSTSVDAERRLIARAEVGRVQGILARMKPAAAQTLLLHDVLGFDMLEVTEITGVSLSAAQSRLVRARKEFLRRAQAELPGFAGGTAQGGRATRLGGSEP